MTLSIAEISEKLNCSVIGDKNFCIKGIATLQNASPDDISFYSNPKYRKNLENTRAGACFVKYIDASLLPDKVIKLICDDPYLAYARLVDMIYVDARTKRYPYLLNSRKKILPTTVIPSSAVIGKNCAIDYNVVIGENVKIGDDCTVGASTYIGDGVIIGDNTHIDANVTIMCCKIGSDCIIHPGVRIGQDGFGFTLDEKKMIYKIQQIGKVVIQDNVEIGANSCIDRGAIEDTVIGKNTKIDNLVQIGHNVEVGANCFIAGQVGIAGSVKIGNYVMIGGQAGISGHVTIGNMVKIAAQSGVSNDVPDGEMVGGYPAVSMVQWHKQTIFLRNMSKKSK